LIAKSGNAGVVSVSLGPRSTIEDQLSAFGPVWIQVMRSFASTTQNSRTRW
jgi:hypothetical protein